MQTVEVQTSLGSVPVWGRFDAFSPARPLLLVVRGVFPIPNHLISLPDRLAHADVALVHLPGVHTPWLREMTLVAFARAFDEVIRALFPTRAVNIFGVSFGGTVALAMRAPNIRRLLLLDPPLSTGSWLVQALTAPDANGAEWLRLLLGPDYSRVLEGLRAPAHVLLSGIPMGEPRPYQILPSMVSEADRQALAACPLVTSEVVEGVGHNIPAGALSLMMARLEALLSDQAAVRWASNVA